MDSFKGETLSLVHSGANRLCKSLQRLLTCYFSKVSTLPLSFYSYLSLF